MLGRIVVAGTLLATPLGGSAPPALAAPKASMNDCFADLEKGNSPQIVCDFPLQPSAAERAEMEKQTAGYVKNVTCTVSIRIERALITTAINAPEHQFEAPPQPVACNVTMPGSAKPPALAQDTIVPITGMFAPKVTIKDSVAVHATPGLTDVKGVSRILSVPVVAYVNRAGFLRDGMLKVVNAWMTHMRVKKAKG